MSLEGMQAYFIAYDYDINCIFALPVKDFTNETIVEAFEMTLDFTRNQWEPQRAFAANDRAEQWRVQ